MRDLPPNSRFSKAKRLLNKAQFEQVFADPHKVTSKHWVVLYRANDVSASRLGILITKQKMPRAIDRNRLKRMVRESFRHQEHLKNKDIIIILRGKRALNDQFYQQLRNEMALLWQALK